MAYALVLADLSGENEASLLLVLARCVKKRDKGMVRAPAS
jgi:hypothetical protein